MLRLMLLRHAHAGHPPGLQDHQRPLSDRGHREAEAVGAYMVSQGLRPDLAIVSTAVRAQQTWQHVFRAFGGAIEFLDEARLYEASVGRIVQRTQELKPGNHTVLLVGHNPGVALAAQSLCGDGDASELELLHDAYPPASLAVVDFAADQWGQVAQDSGKLERFVMPES
ncbi:histidine phosphatase family protein [Alcaligenaceae bacterium]|nr:histidine phosphatase family protein [Alcaligenaceae bacterium]